MTCNTSDSTFLETSSFYAGYYVNCKTEHFKLFFKIMAESSRLKWKKDHPDRFQHKIQEPASLIETIQMTYFSWTLLLISARKWWQHSAELHPFKDVLQDMVKKLWAVEQLPKFMKQERKRNHFSCPISSVSFPTHSLSIVKRLM